ncbi:MAG: hypothetical protein J1E61_03500 [Lachnospiraceae bacterium]|nr:hypothetical protein [Lachnospiraceae bacterium]
MPNGELRIVGQNRRLLEILTLILVIGLGLLIRKEMIWYVSRDWTGYFQIWMEEIGQNGFRALAGDFYDYAPAYMYFLVIAAGFGEKSMVAMKLISVGFDLVLSAGAGLVAHELKKSKVHAMFAFSIVWLAPTVISNSSMWGQCDAIYCSFLILTVLFLLKEKGRLAMIFFGIAFAFKLQALFWLPVIILLWLYKKIKTIDLLWIPAMYLVSIIPAWLDGRPFLSLLGVYFDQTGVDVNRLSMKYPNIYYIIGELNLPQWYSGAGKLFAIGVILLFMVAMIYKLMHTKLTPELLLLIFYSQGSLALYFLPQMHERYGFFLEVLAIILAVLNIKLFWVPVLHILITFITYSYYYNFDQPKNIPIFILSVFMLGIMMFMVYLTVTYDKEERTNEKEA